MAGRLTALLLCGLLCVAVRANIEDDTSSFADEKWDYDAVAETLKEATESLPFFEGTVMNPELAQVG